MCVGCVFGVLRKCESESFVQNNNYDLTSDFGVIKLSHRLPAEYSYKQLGPGGLEVDVDSIANRQQPRPRPPTNSYA